MTSAPHTIPGPEFLAVFAIAFALGLVVGVFALRAWQLSCRRAERPRLQIVGSHWPRVECDGDGAA